MFWKKLFKYDFYLCGPMRGYKDLNKPMFLLVANLLRRKGYTVWSPSEHKSYLQLSFAQCMTVDLNVVINKCREIALLPGWGNSLGANMEVFSAFACGKGAVEILLPGIEYEEEMEKLGRDGWIFYQDEFAGMELVEIDLSNYRLPYQTGRTKKFDPHKCDIDE